MLIIPAILFTGVQGLCQLKMKTLDSGIQIIEPSVDNLVAMLEMSSSNWIEICEKLGYNSNSPYTTARVGYLLMNKGKVREGGSSHISKMGSKSILFEWYHVDNDQQTIFNDLTIKLENNIAKSGNSSVLYLFTHNGKKYSGVLMSSGSQIGFLMDPVQ